MITHVRKLEEAGYLRSERTTNGSAPKDNRQPDRAGTNSAEHGHSATGWLCPAWTTASPGHTSLREIGKVPGGQA